MYAHTLDIINRRGANGDASTKGEVFIQAGNPEREGEREEVERDWGTVRG